jgi:hypothetical protein
VSFPFSLHYLLSYAFCCLRASVFSQCIPWFRGHLYFCLSPVVPSSVLLASLCLRPALPPCRLSPHPSDCKYPRFTRSVRVYHLLAEIPCPTQFSLSYGCSCLSQRVSHRQPLPILRSICISPNYISTPLFLGEGTSFSDFSQEALT